MNKNYIKPIVDEENVELIPFMLESSKEFGSKEAFEVEEDFVNWN